MILLGVALGGYLYNGALVSREIFAGSLLFAMCLQNAQVSLVSGSVVRTTHLTGTFTDLGIELAQLLKKGGEDRPALKSGIKLRAAIIFFFMTGAVAGAYLFRSLDYHAFLVPFALLSFTLFADIFRIRVKRYYQRVHHPANKHK